MNLLARPLAIVAALALGLIALSAKPAMAQSNENQAAVVISLAGIDEQLKDVNYLSDAAGFGRLGGMIINSQAEEYLKGVDTERAIGLFVHIDEDNVEEPTIVGVVPVSDYDEVLDTLSMAGDVDDSGDIDVIAMPTGEDMFIFEKGGYAIFSNVKEALDWAPSNVAKELGDMPKNYNIAAKIFPQRIPESLREQALEAMEEGYARSLEESGADGDDLQQKSFEMQMAQMESLINETEHMTIGFAANKEESAIYFDFEIIGAEGSQLAKSAAAQKDMPKSRFNGFRAKNAMMTLNSTGKILESDKESLRGLIAGFKSQIQEEMDLENADTDEAAVGKEFVDSLFEVLDDTINAGISDGGLVVMGGNAPALAGGFHAVNADKLERSFKKLAEMANESGEMEVEINAESLNGVKLHRASIPVPESEEEMQELFGDTLDILIGVDSKTVYVAAGDNCYDLLKKCVNNSTSAKQGRSVEMNLYLSSMLEMLGSVESEEMMQEMADVLKESGKDRISIWSENVKNGTKARFEVQDGVLKLIAIAAEQFGGAFGGF